jgi:NADPH:quinone reductase-like Zn-dependent oxidoreductase
MKAAVVRQWGEAPEYADFAEPVARDGAVVATVEASALTNLTKGLMSGKHYGSAEIRLPAVAGVDGVARLSDGRRVYTSALAPYGMMAERVPINPDTAVELPEDIDPVIAAAVPNPGISAWVSLESAAEVTPGDHVLVLGATGVTGSVAVQLAKSVFGAGRVTVAGRDAARLQWLRGVGADDVITIGSDDLRQRVADANAERPIDAVLDYLWGEPAEQVFAGLGAAQLAAAYHRTRYVQIGSMAGPTMSMSAGILRSTAFTVTGVGMGTVAPDAAARARSEGLPRLFSMIASGALVLTTQQRPLAEVHDAWTAREPSGTRVVLTP